MSLKKCPKCSAVNFGDVSHCRCGYEFDGSEEVVLVTKPSRRDALGAIYLSAALVSGAVGIFMVWFFSISARSGGNSLSENVALTAVSLAVLAVVFFGTRLLGRVLVSREKSWGMKVFALLLFGLGSALVAVAIFAAGCSLSFRIGG